MIGRIRVCLCLGAVFAACQWLAPASVAPLRAVQASVAGVNCTATLTSINFGNVDASIWGTGWFNGNVNLKTTGFLTYFCTNTSSSQKQADVCISIANPGGTPQRSIRGAGNATLQYQLYTDASNANGWGSKTSSAWGSPYTATVSVPASGTSAPTTVPIYATLASSQSLFTGSGSYSATYGGGDVLLDTGPSGSGCAGASGGGSITGFTVLANVQATCQVSTGPMDFGTLNGDPSGATAITTLSVSCAGNTGYRVGLDNGKNYDNVNRRMRGGPTHSDYVAYQLFRNSGYSQTWGNADGTDTVTGNQGTQNFTVYGKVAPAQGMASGGDYFDAVTVYVYY